MRNLQLYFKVIYAAMDAAQIFIEGTDYESFVVDDKTNSAVVYKLEIIGEVFMHIPDTIQQDYLVIPWQQMTEMSDRLMHNYYDIDYRIVWDTVKDMIPLLQPNQDDVIGVERQMSQSLTIMKQNLKPMAQSDSH